MEDAEISFSKTTIQESILEEMEKGKKYYYIIDKIKDQMERMNWIGKKVTFFIGEREFTLFLLHPRENLSDKLILDWINKIIKRIYCWLYIASMESTKGCSKRLNIYFYFTDFKKQFPPENERNAILAEINVNSAYTFSCEISQDGENEMYIYRKEEWFKVFIHETFHAFSLDFSNEVREIQMKIDKNILKIFSLNIDLRLYETYCEMWAEIINIIYIVFSSRSNQKISKIVELLKIEELFSLFQTIKILNYNHISYNELYEMSESAKIKRIYNYKESSPIISYYVLKSIFMMNVGEYIEWTSLSNKGSLNFRKTDETFDSYCRFISERYNNSNYLKAIEFIKEYIRINKNKNREILNSLKMSIFEMK
jgi:hypothetical protein